MTQDNERNGFIRAKNGNIPNDDEKAEEENLLKPTDEVAAIQTNKKEYFKKSLKEEPDDDPAPSISYFTLFRYATKKDRILIVLALISTTIAGCVTPFNTIVFANVLNAMVAYGSTVGIDPNAADTFMQEVQWFFIWNAIFGVILLVFVYIATVLMNQTAYNQVFIIRQEYLQAALNQDNSWYDLHESGDFASKMTEDLVKLEEGINEKVASFLYYMAAFLSSVIMAFVKGWKLALVCLCSFPVTLILVGSIAMVASKLAKQEAEAYGRAASVAEEVLSAVRTVYAFSGQQKEEQRFLDNLSDAKRINIKRSFFSACMMGILFFCIYASYALSFWYGVRLLQDPSENYDPSTMMAVFFGVMMGSMNFGMSTPLMEVFGVARGAGAQIFRLIDNVPIINPLLDLGARPAAVEGNLRLNNVHFTYPSRPDVPVLKGVDLTVKRGQTVALVGASGCGKSTIVQLLSRFYDPAEGSIQLDENDLRDLSVGWLRSQIGLVGQEPVLFNTTISENIRYGREDATPQQVEAAARAANAHHFIAKLPQGYNTLVGDKGTQLSGGQKQRIAIARALVRNPTILLLDEATSALDNTSEAIVQAALDKARQGRTTVIVAHRLSTIRSADVIYVFKDGRVVESGTHGDLMARRAFYYDMVALQTAPADLPALEPGHQPLDRQESTISKLSEASEIVPEEPMAAGEQDKDEEGREVTFLEVLGYSRPELITNTLACLCSLAVGFGMPLFAILFGDFVGNLSSGDPAVVAAQTNTLSLMFVGLGTAIGLTTFFQTFLFGVAGEKLTERMRHLMFGALLRQEVGFYDDKRNSTGALCAKLSGDASLVQGATGMRIGTVLQGVGSLGLGTAIGLYYEWRVGLVVLAISPLIVVLAYQSIRMSQQQAVGTSKTMEDSTKLAVDVVSNVRTVASLGRQRVFVEEFRAQLAPGLALSRRGTHIRGVVYAASRAMMNFTFAIAMYYGGYLVVNDGVEYADILKTTQALIMSTSSIGNMFAFAPNFDKGIRAAARIINLLERVPKILDPIKPEKEIFNASGDAALVDVHFSYPTRPTVQVLRGLGLDVRRGATVALVGASGCGKSTVIQLLQRFYEPSAGTVYLDGVALRALRVSEARRGIGLVQQEPVLFDRTIGENIAYGDNTRAPTAHEIVQAARDANIHNFIASLPLGYETRLGSKGTQLSGGQKQRIAIARALIRNPKILLLDEATSALDAESEKVVQEALDAAKEGRTCITIAHRLTTIQDADVICVLHQGRVGEIGTHSQLIAKRGLYYKLYQSSYS